MQLDGALRARGLVLQSTRTEIRPAEPPSFADVARWPFQALLPDDPGGGYFVVYAFADADLAAAGGRDLAAYVASGPGRIQFPPDVRFVLRQVGSTLVFYPWSPASSPDPKTPDLAAALASVGTRSRYLRDERRLRARPRGRDAVTSRRSPGVARTPPPTRAPGPA